jgi:hypothetical protein
VGISVVGEIEGKPSLATIMFVGATVSTGSGTPSLATIKFVGAIVSTGSGTSSLDGSNTSGAALGVDVNPKLSTSNKSEAGAWGEVDEEVSFPTRAKMIRPMARRSTTRHTARTARKRRRNHGVVEAVVALGTSIPSGTGESDPSLNVFVGDIGMGPVLVTGAVLLGGSLEKTSSTAPP